MIQYSIISRFQGIHGCACKTATLSPIHHTVPPTPPLDFERSVNPIRSRRGADYAQHITICPPESQNFLRPCKGMVPANYVGVLSVELWSFSLKINQNTFTLPYK